MCFHEIWISADPIYEKLNVGENEIDQLQLNAHQSPLRSCELQGMGQQDLSFGCCG